MSRQGVRLPLWQSRHPLSSTYETEHPPGGASVPLVPHLAILFPPPEHQFSNAIFRTKIIFSFDTWPSHPLRPGSHLMRSSSSYHWSLKTFKASLTPTETGFTHILNSSNELKSASQLRLASNLLMYTGLLSQPCCWPQHSTLWDSSCHHSHGLVGEQGPGGTINQRITVARARAHRPHQPF